MTRVFSTRIFFAIFSFVWQSTAGSAAFSVRNGPDAFIVSGSVLFCAGGRNYAITSSRRAA
jgi:hypothetical protein